MDMAKAQLLIGDVGALLGLPDLAFDADGDCALTIDDTLQVDISFLDEEDALLLVSPLGSPADPLPADLAEAMLDANFFWRGTGGATLGLDRETRMAVLVETVPLAGQHPAALRDRLSDFVTVARDWTDRVAGRTPIAASDVTTVTEEPAGDVILRL